MVRWNSGLTEGTCLLAALQNSADVLVVHSPILIFLNATFFTVPPIPSVFVISLVLVPLKNYARAIAR